MRVIILSIGDELVLGQTVDTNSAYLSGQLARQGISTLYHQTIADDAGAIARAIEQAAETAELIIISGGLGPTDDDLTRQALAEAMGQPLLLHEESLKHIESFFKDRGRTMSDRNKVQALHPRGTDIIVNHHGTAPGIEARFKRAQIYVTPGVPFEMKRMFEKSIAPKLCGGSGRTILSTTIHTLGLGESDVAERLGDLMHRQNNPTVGTTVSDGIVSVRVRSVFAEADRAAQQLNKTVEQVEQALGPIVFGRDDQTIQETLIALFKERNQTLATAESCTGGLLGKLLTDVSGSSAVYLGGWVTYSDAMKVEHLGVPAALVRQYGAVSREVAQAMARGALERSGADLGVSITGVAGPAGGSGDSGAKPVGTVWIALACGAGPSHRTIGTDVFVFHLPGARAAVRDRAAKAALQLMRFQLLDVSLETLSWARRQPIVSAQTHESSG